MPRRSRKLVGWLVVLAVGLALVTGLSLDDKKRFMGRGGMTTHMGFQYQNQPPPWPYGNSLTTVSRWTVRVGKYVDGLPPKKWTAGNGVSGFSLVGFVGLQSVV